MAKRLLLFCSIIFTLLAIKVTPGPLGPGEGEKDLLQVLPNPGNGPFNVLYRSEYRGEIRLSVVDALGKYVFIKTVRDFNGELKESVDLVGNPKGIYIF